jgi:flagellar hook-basal body complex protein FliE
MIDPISSLGSLNEIVPQALTLSPPAPARDFMSVIGEGLGQANASVNAADQATRELAAGQDIPMHDVMISLEKARVDLQFLVQVRNRLVSAYQDITRMQV